MIDSESYPQPLGLTEKLEDMCTMMVYSRAGVPGYKMISCDKGITPTIYSPANIYYICESKHNLSSRYELEKKIPFREFCDGTGLFVCRNGECISFMLVCDGVSDCLDSTDEVCRCFSLVFGKPLQNVSFCCLLDVSLYQCELLHFKGYSLCLKESKACKDCFVCPSPNDRYYQNHLEQQSHILEFNCSCETDQKLRYSPSLKDDTISDCACMNDEFLVQQIHDQQIEIYGCLYLYERSKLNAHNHAIRFYQRNKPKHCAKMVEHRSEMSMYMSEFKCKDDKQIQCSTINKQCFNPSLLCYYDVDVRGLLIPCRNGEHLQKCQNVVCKNTFKCPQSYCIPWRRVCDGSIDCQNAYDELGCSDYSCRGLFRCNHSSRNCLHKSELCDGVAQCPLQDDEVFCDLRLCPAKCTCMLDIIYCNGANLHFIPEFQFQNYRFLVMSYNKLQFDQNSMQVFSKIILLNISHNSLTTIPNNFQLRSIMQYLDMSYNNIKFIKGNIFRGLQHLLILKLHNNPITKVFSHAFAGMATLPTLNLSNLGLQHLEKRALKGLKNIHVVDISHNKLHHLHNIFDQRPANIKLLNFHMLSNPFQTFSHDAFNSLHENTSIHTNMEVVCCISRKVSQKCTFNIGHMEGCERLFRMNMFFYLVGGVTIIELFINITLIVIYVKVIRAHQTSKLLQRRTLVELTMVVSHIFIVLHGAVLLFLDVYYGELFANYKNLWQASVPCKFIHVISFSFLMMSMVCHTISYIDQIYIVIFPFDARNLQSGRLLRVLAFVLILLISGSATILSLSRQTYGDLCFFMFRYKNNFEFLSMIFLMTFLSLDLAILIIIPIFMYVAQLIHKRQQKTFGVDKKSKGLFNKQTYLKAILQFLFCLILFVGSIISPSYGTSDDTDINQFVKFILILLHTLVNSIRLITIQIQRRM